MKPRLNTYCLHSLQGQFFGCHFLRPFLKAFRLVNSFSCKGTKVQICTFLVCIETDLS